MKKNQEVLKERIRKELDTLRLSELKFIHTYISQKDNLKTSNLKALYQLLLEKAIENSK